MATQPWITPQEVRDYTDYDQVSTRLDVKLRTDIMRAERYIIAYTNNDFASNTDYPTLPDTVKTAAILLAEAYAYNSYAATATMKSETLDDYSYTAEVKQIDVESLDIKPLLDGYVKAIPRNGVTMRMRKL